MEIQQEIDLRELLAEHGTDASLNESGETWTADFAASGAGKVEPPPGGIVA